MREARYNNTKEQDDGHGLHPVARNNSDRLAETSVQQVTFLSCTDSMVSETPHRWSSNLSREYAFDKVQQRPGIDAQPQQQSGQGSEYDATHG